MDMGKSGVAAVRHGAFAIESCCQIFGGIWAPPLGTPSEARYICRSLIVKPRRFERWPEPAGPRSRHCAAMSHTRRSNYHHLQTPVAHSTVVTLDSFYIQNNFLDKLNKV